MKQEFQDMACNTNMYPRFLSVCFVLGLCLAQTIQAQSEPDQIASSLPELLSAVEADPSDVAARGRYAMALYQLGNFPAAWEQLSAARKLDPNHTGIANGVEAVLKSFEATGVFSVGTPAETIQALLGDPEHVRNTATGLRWVYAFWAIDFRDQRVHDLIDLRGATEAMFQPTEFVSVDLDGRGWRCGHRRKAGGVVSAYYYRPGESLTQWTEQIEVERILNASTTGASEEIGKRLVEQMVARQPGTQYKVLRADEDSIFLAFQIPGREKESQRHQLVRLMKAPVDVHRIAYTLKSDMPPTEDQQRKWLEIFVSATLTKVQQP